MLGLHVCMCVCTREHVYLCVAWWWGQLPPTPPLPTTPSPPSRPPATRPRPPGPAPATGPTSTVPTVTTATTTVTTTTTITTATATHTLIGCQMGTWSQWHPPPPLLHTHTDWMPNGHMVSIASPPTPPLHTRTHRLAAKWARGLSGITARGVGEQVRPAISGEHPAEVKRNEKW